MERLSGTPGGGYVTQADDSKGDAIARFTHDVMSTTFQVHIAGESQAYARSAATEVFRLWDRLEGLLSRFVEYSDISRINRLRCGEAARVGIEAFTCLQTAAAMATETGGAFDAAIGSLTKGGRGNGADAAVGMHYVALDESAFTVRILAEGIELDLGGIGKGFALDQAAALLDEWGVDSALLCASESTVLALGAPPCQQGWRVGIGGQPAWLTHRALSGSGVAVKGGHIIDPHTRQPVQDKAAAWAACTSATEADALSTAFMVMPPGRIKTYCRAHPEVSAAIQISEGGVFTYFGRPF